MEEEEGKIVEGLLWWWSFIIEPLSSGEESER